MIREPGTKVSELPNPGVSLLRGSENDLQCVRLGGIRKDRVRLKNLVALETVGTEWLWVEPPLGHQLQKSRRRMGIDQPGRDGDVLDPKRLEMQGCWMTMDPDIGHAASRPYKLRAQLERLRNSDRFDGDVSPQPVAQSFHHLHRVFRCAVDGDIRTERRPSTFEARVSDVDRYDLARTEEPGRHHGRETDRACADHHDDIAGADVAVQHTYLEASRNDVGDEEHLLVAQPFRD